MTLRELRVMLDNNAAPTDLIVFVCEENDFLANQYVEELCRVKACDKVEIQSIYEPLASSLSLVLNYDNNLSVLKTDVFDEAAADYSEFTNTVVICNKVDKKLTAALESYIIPIPKLQKWHIQSYVKKLCPALEDNDIDYLIDSCSTTEQKGPVQVTTYHIYKIINEIDKLTLFPQDMQRALFYEILRDPNSGVYSANPIYIVCTAIIKRDLVAIKDFLEHIKYYKVDPVGLTTLLLDSLKLGLFLTQKSGVSATDLGLSNGRAYHLRQDFASYTAERFFKQLEFLTNIDLRIKASELDMPQAKFVEYIISQLMAC